MIRDDLVLDGMQIGVSGQKPQVIAIHPLSVYHHECEGALTLGEPGWRGDFLLPKTAWVFRALRPGSLAISLAEPPNTRLAEGRDYLIDSDWGSVSAAPGSPVPAGAKLRFAYQCTLSRTDLVEQAPDGALRVKQGAEDMAEPLLPETSPGSMPVFSVYLPHNTAGLTPENISIIDPGYRGIPPVSGVEHIGRVKAKLAAGEPVTIVFFGDSITDQGPGDFRDGKGSYVDRFVSHLRERRRNREIVVTPKEAVIPPRDGRVVVVKAGVGGDDTVCALARIENDVLAHRPDLVVVMFGVNDENRIVGEHGRDDANNVPPPDYSRNLRQIVTRVKNAGSDAILMTTSMKNTGWEGAAGNLGEYAEAARRVARDEQVCLVDNFQVWQDLPRMGYNYMVFLSSCINHPGYLGHRVFAAGLEAAFEDL